MADRPHMDETLGVTTDPAVNDALPAGGPFDSRDYGDPGDLVDAGALWLPLVPEADLKFTVDASTRAVLAAVYVCNGSALQLQAYAAPRSSDIWDGVRLDMRTSIAEQGGTSRDVQGVFGIELLARIPNSTGQGPAAATVRFIGIDGPRWLLKATLTGSAATDSSHAQPLLGIIAQVVVHRGQEPRPPKEMLGLKIPAKLPARATLTTSAHV